ncbi:IucA/IucC family protein [Shimazuella kribbensis]|uniref:IucA/IucC family protein n=1 Tax=Shimazuella kribbensis TaxID=139808 RepID=UPI00041E3372|nr:IucA/IucC family siderophore biosynthesis protein [Shimazuella kribbensis]
MNNQKISSILSAETWVTVSRNLLTKMIAEFMYEEIITPKCIDTRESIAVYQLTLKNEVTYTFEAKSRVFDSYHVFSESIRRHHSGLTTQATNPIQFILDLQSTIGMTSSTTAHLIREYNHTLIADAHIWKQKQHQEQSLTQMEYSEIEGEMDGHPWITYNKGRIGFGYQDYLAYAPEQKQLIQLAWIGVHKKRADFQAIDGMTYRGLIQEELDEQQITLFEEQLIQRKVDPKNYYMLPVHDWQWDNYIIPFFAEELAKKYIIYLGTGKDHYLPQQSIRTFVNQNEKKRHHIKLPMSILNTLVYRGLPNERTVLAPKITSYITNIHKKDTFLNTECRVILPGEIASINYDHPYYSSMEDVPYHYQELLGCIWRESIYSYLNPAEKPITLASLLHVDKEGIPFITKLQQQSGLSWDEWLNRLFTVILHPLLHYLYRYGVVFSPHGQNTILVLNDSIPYRLAIKDFVDDVNISQQALPELADIPVALKKILRSENPEGLCQFIFTGLFICHMRYLSDLLETHHSYSEAIFWRNIRQVILDYQNRFPEWEDRYRLFDLLRPKFTKLCLNRNRMLDDGYENGEDRPHASEYGFVNNILSKY